MLGIFPFRLHAHRGRAVTHLMDDPIVPDDDGVAAARDAGLPYFRGGIVEHGGAGQPIMEAMHLAAGRAALAARCSTRPMRDRMAVFTMQGEDLPQADEPHRPRPARARRLGLAGGPGHVPPAPPRGRVRRSTGRRASRR